MTKSLRESAKQTSRFYRMVTAGLLTNFRTADLKIPGRQRCKAKKQRKLLSYNLLHRIFWVKITKNNQKQPKSQFRFFGRPGVPPSRPT
jgi:hypothetical protein